MADCYPLHNLKGIKMNLTFIDWSIVGILIIAIAALGWYTKRYTNNVTDFLAGNRCAGRYLLTVSQGMAGMGAISMVAIYEKFYSAGFGAGWWGMMLMPIGLFLSLSGFVLYRFRETRALTMAQFIEMRYSKRLRVFSGFLCWISGTLNYGIFPAVTARFLIHFCGFPLHFELFGFQIMTLIPVMLLMLGIALYLTFSGGQIAVMITDFAQGQIMNLTFIVIIFILFKNFHWASIVETLKAAPPGESMLNPFKQSKISDFNFWFFAILAFRNIYGHKAWQGAQGYNCSAKSPHEAKMGGILGEWRNGITLMTGMLIPVCAYVLMHNSGFSDAAEIVNTKLAAIGDPQIQKQMIVPLALAEMLPMGIMGLFTVVIMAAAISTDDTYLHSWGSIFIQDVVLPFKKKPLSQKAHLKWLKISIFGIAAFSFFFSLFFPLKDYILMYMRITGAIYMGGAGSMIIGGLYWKRGTTAGAWTGMCVGSFMAIGGIIIKTILPTFPYNGVEVAFGAMTLAIISYIIVSLLTCKKSFNMDKLFHRGKYNDHPEDHLVQDKSGKKSFMRRFGITDEFSTGDKLIYFMKIAWIIFWMLCFIVGVIINLAGDVSDDSWAKWWLFRVEVTVVVGIISFIWFSIGGIYDIITLFKLLKTSKHEDTDDGRVEKK